MTIIIQISQPINRLGNLIELNPSRIPTRIYLPDDSSSDHLFNQYLQGKRRKIYQLPISGSIKVMKGKFFYDQQTQRYLTDPSNWWVSEKLDGIRAIWTGTQLLTRQGKIIYAPKWFTEGFPTEIALDGELYMGRNKFNQVQSTVLNHQADHYSWKKVKYQVFDVPDAKNLSFEQVQQLLKNHLPDDNKYLQLIPQSRVTDLSHLLQIQRDLVKEGAEGTMLRKPNSRYQIGLTSDLLKFKTQMTSESERMVHLLDDVGIIVGYKYNYDKKAINGQPALRSLLIRWEDKDKFGLDPEFSVSHQITQDQKLGDYRQLFPVNQRVKIFYNQLFSSSQKPRFPRYGGQIKD